MTKLVAKAAQLAGNGRIDGLRPRPRILSHGARVGHGNLAFAMAHRNRQQKSKKALCTPAGKRRRELQNLGNLAAVGGFSHHLFSLSFVSNPTFIMIQINSPLMLHYAQEVIAAPGPDYILDSKICVAFNYLKGRIFPEPLTVLSNGTLVSPDGIKLGYADGLSRSGDAVDMLRTALFPSSAITISHASGGERYWECLISARNIRGIAISDVTRAATEPLARLSALLMVSARAETVPVLE